ncbi:MAG TPA: O-antigen ligase family protein [Thermoleophilaceae bacterium]|nr:O-antigen ligase family protein [Thermoleophilaceae bacterium]
MAGRLRPAAEGPSALAGTGRFGETAPAYLVAGVLGIVVGLIAYVAGSAGVATAGVVAVAAGVPVLLVALGKAQRLLLGVLILEIPLQWDVYLNYNDAAGELGAIGGLNLSLTTLVLAALYMGWAADWLTGRRAPAGRAVSALVPFGVYLAINLLSVVTAQDSELALYYVVLLAQMGLVLCYVACRVRSRSDVTLVVVMLILALLLEGLAILSVRIFGVDLDVFGIGSDTSTTDSPFEAQVGPRLEGTLGTPNTAAAYLAMLLPIAATALATRMHGAIRALAAVSLVVGFPALILTFSRGGWLATIVSFLVLLVIGARRGLVPPRVLAVVLAVMLMVGLPLYGAVGARLTSGEGAALSRVPLMDLAVQVVSDYPVLGVGANNFASVVTDYAGPEFSRDWIYTVHNKYLLVASETGLLALAAFVWFLVAVLRRAAAVWRFGDRWAAPVAIALTAALCGQIVNMAVDLYNNRAELQLLMVVCGLVIALNAFASRAEA